MEDVKITHKKQKLDSRQLVAEATVPVVHGNVVMPMDCNVIKTPL